MTDLITRLRQRLGDAWALNDEAADEIERLQKDNAEKDRALTVAIRVAKKDKADNAKLRAVLQDIADYDGNGPHPINVALAALIQLP